MPPSPDYAPDQPADPPRGLPVDWALAARTAAVLMPPGPQVSPAEAHAAVEQLRADAATAQEHVRELTGLGTQLPPRPPDVVDRPTWAAAATAGIVALTDGARLPVIPATARKLTATTTGLQAGAVLSYLGSRVLGQYDPFGGPSEEGRLLLVAPNVVAAQRLLDVPFDEFSLWVCMHVVTHQLQFTAVPWLRSYFAHEVCDFLSAVEDSASGLLERLPEVITSMRRGSGGSGDGRDGPALLELLQGPRQRAVLDRLMALTTLLEGHADYVMDAVGPSVVPSVSTIRARFTERRRGGSVLDRLLRVILGVEAKVRQYAIGAAFTQAVVEAVGMTGFNTVWSSVETLPTRAELTQPDQWVSRVAPARA